MQAKDSKLLAWATEIKIRAERKAGVMLKEMAEKGERATRKSSATKELDLPKLANIGISRKQSSNWQRIAEIPEQELINLLKHFSLRIK